MVPERPYSRLTVLAPRRTVDVALPADVPVADLVPMVLELVGEPDPNSAWRPEPFRLSGVAGGPLPGSATLAELGVLDGEMLRIGRDAPPPAAPVFDDPVDALAASAGAARHGDRQFGSVAVLLVVLAAAGLLATGGPGTVGAALLAGFGALAALGVVRSAARDPAAGVARTAALAAVPLAAAAGWAGMSGPPGAGPVLVAVAAAGTAAAAGQVLLRVVEPALVAVVVTAVLAAAALVGIRSGLPVTAAGAAIAAVAVVAGPLLPRVAIRLAGLPGPVVPADGSELVDADSGPDLLPPDELAERADLARGYLAGLAAACAVTAAAGAVLAAAAGGWAGPAFAGVTVVVLGLRARGYADAVPARVAMSAAIACGVALAGLAGGAAGATATVAAAGLLVAAAVGVLALGRVQPLGSPVSRRAVDLLEGLLVALSVPLALAAMDLYRLVREW
jgi:type VII secretion integral membrane protein EccD